MKPEIARMVRRKTIGKRMAAKLKECREKLRQRIDENIDGTVKWLPTVVRGYFQYHAVPGNESDSETRGWTGRTIPSLR